MSATDIERLDTFMPELADQALGHLHAEASGSFRAGKKRHLVINPGGTFYDFVTGNAGRGAIKLLCFLHQCKQDGAVLIAETFLKDNPGTGSLSSSVAADEDAETAEEDLVRTTAINNEQAAQPIDGYDHSHTQKAGVPSILTRRTGRSCGRSRTSSRARPSWSRRSRRRTATLLLFRKRI